MFKEKSLKHGIQVEYAVEEAPGTIIADEMKIKQVLVNLLSNAFKYAPDNSSVHVHARKVQSSPDNVIRGQAPYKVQSLKGIDSELRTLSAELDADFIEISVADTGPGIKPEDIPKLFQPFQQLETTLTKKVPGTGLGLNLCKNTSNSTAAGYGWRPRSGRGASSSSQSPSCGKITLRRDEDGTENTRH